MTFDKFIIQTKGYATRDSKAFPPVNEEIGLVYSPLEDIDDPERKPIGACAYT